MCSDSRMCPLLQCPISLVCALWSCSFAFILCSNWNESTAKHFFLPPRHYDTRAALFFIVRREGKGNSSAREVVSLPGLYGFPPPLGRLHLANCNHGSLSGGSRRLQERLPHPCIEHERFVFHYLLAYTVTLLPVLISLWC